VDLTLFILFLIISFVLITLGLHFSVHTELSLIGFLFLFLLSLSFITQDVSYKIGVDTNTTYTYGVNETVLTTTETARDVYDTVTAGALLDHTFGYWLAVISIVGFIGVVLSIKNGGY